MSKVFSFVAAVFALAGACAEAQAQDVALACSSTAEAKAVIAGSVRGAALVSSVAQSVPTDVENCVPSYCEAVQGEEDSVKVAVGAGISSALSAFLASEDTVSATGLLSRACSGSCDEVVVTSFAASQSVTVADLCETSFGGAPGSAASALQLEASGVSGGGQSASDN